VGFAGPQLHNFENTSPVFICCMVLKISFTKYNVSKNLLNIMSLRDQGKQLYLKNHAMYKHQSCTVLSVNTCTMH